MRDGSQHDDRAEPDTTATADGHGQMEGSTSTGEPTPNSAELKNPDAPHEGPVNGWTHERRARQAMLIKRWKPWTKSTGPVTDEGKAASSHNAYVHGECTETYRELLKSMRASIRMARERQRRVQKAIIRAARRMCGAPTRRGGACKRRPSPGGRCYQHHDM
jgi:hypothetical protein